MAVKSLGVDVVLKYLDYDKLMELKRELDKNTYRWASPGPSISYRIIRGFRNI